MSRNSRKSYRVLFLQAGKCQVANFGPKPSNRPLQDQPLRELDANLHFPNPGSGERNKGMTISHCSFDSDDLTLTFNITATMQMPFLCPFASSVEMYLTL